MGAVASVGITTSMMVFTAILAMGVPSPASVLVAHSHLTISPGTVGAPGDVNATGATCPYSSLAWHCSLTLRETTGSNVNARWSSSGSGQSAFSPSHGTLRPGSAITVTATVSSCGGDYLLNFTGPQNTAQATFTCG